MDLLLDEQQRIFAETAARLCADLGGAKRLRALRQAGSEIDREAWRAAMAAGWLSTVVADGDGMAASGAFDLALALEQAGRQLMLLPLAEAGAVAATLSQRPSHAPALAGLLDGTRLIVPATDSPAWHYGRSSEGVSFNEESCELNGTVACVAYARSADAFLVDAGMTLCIVPAKAAGVTLTSSNNVDGSASGRIVFAKVHVPSADVVAQGTEAQRLAMRMQEFLALGTAVELIGLAAGALDVTLDYIKLRQQFGRPIGSFQVLQHRAVDGFIDIELNRSLVYRVLADYDAGEHHLAMVAAAKARASRSALEIVRAALQMHGAIGYTEEHDIGLYYKRATALAARYGGELNHTVGFSALTRDTEQSVATGGAA